MSHIFQGAFWFGLYLLLILFPLVVGSIFRPANAPDSILTNLSAAFGYIGFGIMALEMALIARIQRAASAFGLDALQQFHKQIGYVAVCMVLAHPALLLLDGYPWRILLPTSAVPWSVSLGTYALLCLILLVGLSIFRKKLRISYEIWQISHWLFTVAVLGLSAIHIVAVGRYAQSVPMKLLWLAYLGMVLGIFLYYRLVKPLQLLSRPWRVVENREELGRSRTLVLAPVGHPGFAFEAGQFAWINTHRSPFHFDQHPISFSSCGDRAGATGEIAFTIKDLGNWSGEVVPTLKPGARVWIDGPHGVFSLDRESGPGYVFLAGGVGITPLRSMLLTMSEREDTRPVVLFYGAATEKDLTFRDELLEMQKHLNLKVVYVLERPPQGWNGETGRISPEVLKKHLPARQFKHWQYFICGPGPMMDAMERLVPRIGVPLRNIHTERFDMV